MKTTIFFVSLALLPFITVCQTNSDSIDPQNMEVVTEQEPFFPGGDGALKDYVKSNMQVPDEYKGKSIDGKIELSFDVNPDSTLSNIIVLSSTLDDPLNDAIMDVFKNIKYAPAVQMGIKVRMQVITAIPVRMRVEN